MTLPELTTLSPTISAESAQYHGKNMRGVGNAFSANVLALATPEGDVANKAVTDYYNEVTPKMKMSSIHDEEGSQPFQEFLGEEEEEEGQEEREGEDFEWVELGEEFTEEEEELFSEETLLEMIIAQRETGVFLNAVG